MLKQRKLAAAVATLVGASAASIGTSQAGVAFFPFLVNGQTITSIVSTMNEGIGDEFGPWEETLHYRLYYKSIEASHHDPCIELDIHRPTSKYDINTVDTGGYFGDETLNVLFNDPSVVNYPLTTGSFAIGDVDVYGAHRGYLLVDNNDSGGAVAGEMFILELTSGAAWGYQALQSEAANATQADFTTEASANPSQVAIMPLNSLGSDVITKFAVTPVGTDMSLTFGTDYATTVFLQVDKDGQKYAAWDRDEVPVSAGVKKKVVCVGVVEASELIANGENQLPDGGWSNLYFAAPVPNNTQNPEFTPVDKAIAFKVEYGVDTFNQEALQGQGIYNNGIRLEPEMQE